MYQIIYLMNVKINVFFLQTDYSEHISISPENIKHKIIKINQIRNSNTHNMKSKSIEKIVDIQNYDNEINTNTYECDKSLKELKETTILLRQKLDRLESEKNLMDVEYVQVFCFHYNIYFMLMIYWL